MSKTITETEESPTEKIIFESRKSVFKTTLVYVVLIIMIIVIGFFIALFINDLIGALIIVVCVSLCTAIMSFAMFLQTRPLQIEVERLRALKESEDE